MTHGSDLTELSSTVTQWINARATAVLTEPYTGHIRLIHKIVVDFSHSLRVSRVRCIYLRELLSCYHEETISGQ